MLKVFGTYMITDAFSLGDYIRAQSGSPWNDKAINWNNGYRLNLEPTGTNRNDFWTNVDFLAAYNLRFGGRFVTRLEARVLNLFNTQTALSVDDRPFLDPRTRLFDGTQVAGDPASYTRAHDHQPEGAQRAVRPADVLRAAATAPADGTRGLLAGRPFKGQGRTKKSQGLSRDEA